MPANTKSIPLSGYLWALVNGAGAVNADIDSAADHLCRTHSVFHWWLAFPQVAAKGGFSVILANPPWERIKLQEEEFFANRSPLVAMAKNKSERGKRIELLRQGLLLHTLYPDVEAAEGLHPPSRAEMRLHEEFIMARRGAEAASLYAHDSGRFPLTGVGDVNTYSLFAESIYQLIAPRGRAGFIVPTGIATDDTTKAYFEAVTQSNRLVALYSFENEEFIFPAVHHAMKFCLVVIGGSDSAIKTADFVHFARQVNYLYDEARRFTLTPEDFLLINPNTRTCPVFRTQRDAELTKKIYSTTPVLILDGAGPQGEDVNPWSLKIRRVFDMANAEVVGACSPVPAKGFLPMHEAKMIHQFDHRWATYVDAPDKPNGLDTADLSDAQRTDPACTVRPRYWVDQAQVLTRIARVPSRIANAWLAWHEAAQAASVAVATGMESAALRDALKECAAKLTLALASWVAGELFRRSAGLPTPATTTDKPGWSTAVAWKATQTAEALLATRHPALALALLQDDISGKKALPAFTKWALQEANVGLSDVELTELEVLQKPPTANATGSATVSIAANAHSTWARGQFCLDFMDAWMDRRSPQWLMGWRDITNATNERTVIASVVPRSGTDFTVRTAMDMRPRNLAPALLANLNSMVLDFVCRQKIGGTHLADFIIKQLPVLNPERYTEADLAYIVPRVLELTHTAHDMQAWADDLAAYDPRPVEQRTTPYGWHPERRAQLRAELDAYYARLYGLTRDELRYILDPADAPFGPGGALLGPDYPSETFRGLKNKEEKAFGEYRTRRLVLAAWDSWVADAVSLPTYSAHGVISNKSDADFAGLIAAIVQQSTVGISVVDIQATIVHSRTAAAYLEAAEAARLDVLATTVDALRLDSALTSIPPIVQRLEASGAFAKRRTGDTNLYSAGPQALPADVSSRPEHVELAQLMLLLEARRASARSELGGDTEQDRLVQGNR